MHDHIETAATTLAAAEIRYGRSSLALRHLRHDGNGLMACRHPATDAYVAIIQMGDLPSHDYWLGGRHHHQPGGNSQAVNIFHLEAEPACRIGGENDNLHLHIPRAALDELADEIGASRVAHLQTTDGWEAHDGVIGGLKQAIAASFVHRGSGPSLFLDHAVLALHAHIARIYGGMQPRSRQVAGGLAPWQERRAKELMAEHLERELSLAEVANACQLSLSHFTRAFKVSTSTTPHAWRQALRVERAKTLLQAFEMSLAEIALRCGFADQSHFTRVFSGLAGSTPGAWRRLRAA